MKRLGALLLCAALLLSPALAAEGAPAFSDVDPEAWYASYVGVCVEAGLMEGTGDSRFSPDAPLTLAEVPVLSARLHHILQGGDGVLPPLPEDPEDYFGLWNSQGERILGILDVKEFSLSKNRNFLWITLKGPVEEDTLHLRVGFPGDTIYLDADGTLEAGKTEVSTDPFINAIMPEGTRVIESTNDHYSFPLPKGIGTEHLMSTLNGYLFAHYDPTWVESYWNEWYFPATFYLSYREGIFSWVCPRAEAGLELSSADSALREELILQLWDVCTAGDALEQSVLPPQPPDVPGDRYSGEQARRIMHFYQAGILTGCDEAGRFCGDQPLTRAEAAAILARVLKPELRAGY